MIKRFLLLLFVTFSFCINIYTQAANSQPYDILFHGSPNSKIEILKPNQLNVRDSSEGKVIFATPSIKVASCFLFSWDDSWVNLTISSSSDDNTNFTVIMVISDQNEFIKRDKGGSIYLLPIENFSYKEDKGLGIYEWISKDNIVPYEKIIFSSSLEAMQKYGVKVHFVTLEQFNNYLKLPGEKQGTFLNKLK